MRRSFMELAALAPHSVGAAFGAVGGIVLMLLLQWFGGEFWRSAMGLGLVVAVFIGGPVGACWGAIVGGLLARRKRPPPPRT